MPRGGFREGAGRKKKYGEPSKLQRVPQSYTPKDVEKAVRAKQIIEQLTELIEDWQEKAEEAATESVTGKVPRTYDQALKLLAELKKLIPGD